MESDSSDAECLPDLESLDDFLAFSFDINNEDEVEGSQENADSLGLEPYLFEPFVEGAEHEDSDSESRSDSDTDSSSSSSSGGDLDPQHLDRLQNADWWEFDAT